MSEQPGPSESQSFLDDNAKPKSFDLITKQFESHQIDIYGTYEEPLFLAKQIGKLLGIKNIRDNIKNYDERYKRFVDITDITGRIQKQQCFTFKGVCRVVFLSRKEEAIKFQEWIADVVDEIRLTGEYKFKQKTDEIFLQNQQLIEENERYKKEREKYIISFEKEPYQRHLYTFRQGNELRSIHYIGQSKGVQARLQGHKNSNCEGLKDVYKFPCINDKLCETIIQSILEKQGYHFKNDHLSSGSFYRCDLDYILLLSKHVCNTINTLYQCRQSIQQPELIQKISDEFSIEHVVKQDNDNLLYDFIQSLSFQDNQQHIDFNEEQEESNYDENQNINHPVFDWFLQNVKYQNGKFLLSQDLLIKYQQDTQNEITVILLNKKINEVVKQRSDIYKDVDFKKIDRNNAQGLRINGQAFVNCCFKHS